ncbi:hypothetical protein [Fontivita pretiosa]|uniref:hypothetical protein n=1 Tax=Fontivita pretiosa TaxID=2989684 RepID=UPI003D17864C
MTVTFCDRYFRSAARLHCMTMVGVLMAGLWAILVGAARGDTATTAAHIPDIVQDSPLLQRALTDPDFFKTLDASSDAQQKLRAELGDAKFRKVGSTRSVRVQLWRGTTTEWPAIVLEYQTEFKRFTDLPSGGPAQKDPVLIGTGRDSMWHRTFYGGTDDPQAHEQFEKLLAERRAMPSNRRRELDPRINALATQYLPNTPLAQVRQELKSIIEALVEANRAGGAHVLEQPQYGHFGAKISDTLYLYIRDFPADAPTRFEHDPFLWLIVSGGPKPLAGGYLPAFPGAQGMGAQTTGGRGGKVIYVTNLNPDGPGSLKEALLAKGPRIVLFKVSGQIVLPDETWITEPNLTMIGYTAPGEGVEVTGRLCVAADNIILRGMRFRLRPPRSMDGMNTRGNLRNIIFDNCSFAYASDELLRFIGNGSTLLGFTIQYCLLGPGMAGLGSHPYGPEVGGYGSFHHNLFYNALSRSPEVDCDLIDWSYNIMANLRSGHSLRPHSRFNFTNNLIIDIPGNPNAYSFDANDSVWAAGNVRESGGTKTVFQPQHNPNTAFLKGPYHVVPLPHDSPETLESKLLPIVGAFLPTRDATDRYFLDRFQARQSKLPYWQKEGTVWRPYGNENDNMALYEKWEEKNFPPPAAGAQGPADSDEDGMPDEWESANRLNPNDASDGPADADGDGYTNVEEYLYFTNPQEHVDYTNPANNVHTLHLRAGAR